MLMHCCVFCVPMDASAAGFSLRNDGRAVVLTERLHRAAAAFRTGETPRQRNEGHILGDAVACEVIVR